MSNKAALILAVGLFASVALYRLFSPYQQCVIVSGYTKAAIKSCNRINAYVGADVTTTKSPSSVD